MGTRSVVLQKTFFFLTFFFPSGGGGGRGARAPTQGCTLPGSLKHPPPHPWKLSTYAKKATVSVLYWYEKLSGQMTDNLWKRPRKGPIFFCPFRPWVCGARPWATVFPPFFCRAQTAAKTRFHRFARVPASFGANKARFTHSASAPTSPIGSRRDPTVRCGPTTQRTDAIQAPFFTLFVPFFRAPPPDGRSSVGGAGRRPLSDTKNPNPWTRLFA